MPHSTNPRYNAIKWLSISSCGCAIGIRRSKPYDSTRLQSFLEDIADIPYGPRSANFISLGTNQAPDDDKLFRAIAWRNNFVMVLALALELNRSATRTRQASPIFSRSWGLASNRSSAIPAALTSHGGTEYP